MEKDNTYWLLYLTKVNDRGSTNLRNRLKLYLLY